MAAVGRISAVAEVGLSANKRRSWLDEGQVHRSRDADTRFWSCCTLVCTRSIRTNWRYRDESKRLAKESKHWSGWWPVDRPRWRHVDWTWRRSIDRSGWWAFDRARWRDVHWTRWRTIDGSRR